MGPARRGREFGIVTSFEYRLHQVGLVLGGMVVYPLNQGRPALQLYEESSSNCPDEISTMGLLFKTPSGDPAGDSEQPRRDAYGPNFERLASLKKQYDPTNFFAGNQNV